MKLRRAMAVAVLLVTAAASSSTWAQRPVLAGPPIRITYAYSDGNLPVTMQAFKAVLNERPDLRGRVELIFLTESMYAELKPETITGSSVRVLDTMNQQLLDRYNDEHRVGRCCAGAFFPLCRFRGHKDAGEVEYPGNQHHQSLRPHGEGMARIEQWAFSI